MRDLCTYCTCLRASTGIPHAGTDVSSVVTRVLVGWDAVLCDIIPCPLCAGQHVLSWEEPQNRGPGDVTEHSCRARAAAKNAESDP